MNVSTKTLEQDSIKNQPPHSHLSPPASAMLNLFRLLKETGRTGRSVLGFRGSADGDQGLTSLGALFESLKC